MTFVSEVCPIFAPAAGSILVQAFDDCVGSRNSAFLQRSEHAQKKRPSTVDALGYPQAPCMDDVQIVVQPWHSQRGATEWANF